MQIQTHSSWDSIRNDGGAVIHPTGRVYIIPLNGNKLRSDVATYLERANRDLTVAAVYQERQSGNAVLKIVTADAELISRLTAIVASTDIGPYQQLLNDERKFESITIH